MGVAKLVEYPRNVWSSTILAVGYVAAAVLLLVRARVLLGAGLLLGAVATAPTGHLYAIVNLTNSDAVGPAGPGLWLDLTTATLLVIAAVLVVAGLRSRLVHYRAPDVMSWLLIGCGVLSTVTFFFEEMSLDNFNPGPDTAPLVLASVMAVVVPALAAMTGPRQFAEGLLTGWLFTVAATMAFSERFGFFGGTLVLLYGVAVVGFVRARTEH